MVTGKVGKGIEKVDGETAPSIERHRQGTSEKQKNSGVDKIF